MLRHRVYRLKTKVSLLGLELADWFVILLSWLLLKQGLNALVGERLSLLAAAIGTFLVFRLWQGLKDKVPEKFVLHLISWFAEADSYRLYPDFKTGPLTVTFGHHPAGE